MEAHGLPFTGWTRASLMRRTVFSIIFSSATSWFSWDASMTDIQCSPSEMPTRKRCGALLPVDGLKRLMPAAHTEETDLQAGEDDRSRGGCGACWGTAGGADTVTTAYDQG